MRNPLMISPDMEIDPAESLAWWLALHEGNTAAAAIAAGTSRRTVQRWVAAGTLPADIAHLVEQIKNGPAVERPFRYGGRHVIRPSWRNKLGHIADEHMTAHRRRMNRELIDRLNGWD